MNHDEIAELLKGSVPDITAKLDGMDRPDLVELLAQESEGKNRESLTKALAKAIEVIDTEDDPPAEDAAPAEEEQAIDTEDDPSAEDAAPAEEEQAPEWKSPTYAGPLTGDQAQWRNANLKRADLHGTK